MITTNPQACTAFDGKCGLWLIRPNPHIPTCVINTSARTIYPLATDTGSTYPVAAIEHDHLARAAGEASKGAVITICSCWTCGTCWSCGASESLGACGSSITLVTLWALGTICSCWSLWASFSLWSLWTLGSYKVGGTA